MRRTNSIKVYYQCSLEELQIPVCAKINASPKPVFGEHGSLNFQFVTISHAFASSVSRNGCPVGRHNYISFLLCQVFEGNKDSNSVFTNRLSQPIRARYIRFIPVEWHNHISMRVEIYGCPGVLHLQIILLELYMV